MNKEIIFDSAWNAIESGCKIWNLDYKMSQISFCVTRKFFFGKCVTYKVILDKSDDGLYNNTISTVSYVDLRTKEAFNCKRYLNRLYFVPALRKNQGFSILLLYLVDILSIEVDRTRRFNL